MHLSLSILSFLHGYPCTSSLDRSTDPLSTWVGGGGGGGTGFLETKANRDSQSSLEKVSFFGWYSQSGTREYLPALAGLADLVLENIFPTG